MPIDPSIALGVRPVEMPNVLGQFGQMVAIKAAQQEMEGNEGSRNALAKGMEPTDPRILQYGKSGRETFKAAGEGRIKQLEAASKSNLLLGSIFGGVLQDPTTGPQAVARLKDMGLLTEAQAQKVIVEAGNNPDVWRRIAKPYYDGAISAEKRLAEETSIENNKRTVGASYYGSNVSRDNSIRADKREREKLQIVTGDDGFYTISPFDPNSARPVGMAPPPPPARPPVTNALVNPATASTIVNAPTNSLLPTVQSQPGAPTVANAPTNILRPAKPIRQPVAVIKDGVVTLVPPEQAVGMTPATPGAEKALEKTVIAKEGKQAVNGVLNTLYSEYTNLVKSGGITDTRKSVEDNIAARTGASGLGQLTGSYTGSESQSFRDTIEQTRPLLLTAIMKATGLSATQLNSNVELQTYLKTATDPKVSIQSNVKALNNISTMFGLGEKFEVPDIKPPKETKPTDAAPAGLSPEIAKLWQYMTPEDRKLWQK
jgi:hypothetical protein